MRNADAPHENFDTIIRFPELHRRLAISRATAWRWARAGILPKSVRVGPRVVGWRASEIEAFIRSRRTAGEGAAQ
jgi:prophage regulatory protein